MSKRNETIEAYKIAAALLQYNLEHGLVKTVLDMENGKTEEEKSAILGAFRRLIVSLKKQAR